MPTFLHYDAVGYNILLVNSVFKLKFTDFSITMVTKFVACATFVGTLRYFNHFVVEEDFMSTKAIILRNFVQP